ncbi:mediator complex subunit Med5-domain-containing protein [Cyathus striatus]|nr:mediator complex subunit Med5-domain-containing protein [Cyathus striatus]
MSLLELTRNSFQSGISARKWLSLCKLLISKDSIAYSSENVEKTLSNAVLSLFRSYPGDPDLQEYLRFPLQEGTISVAVFVSTMLQAVRSPELHTPTTLQMLCSVALDAHKASGLPALGSIILHSESPISILNIVQDALAFLRIAHSIPISHLHNSSSELVILILSCVTDLSQVPSAQAMVNYADVNDLMHSFRLSPDVRQALDDFALSLSYVIGDEAKAAREAQTIHSIQFALNKGDILGPSSESDVVTLSLILHHLVVSRSGICCGSGNGPDAVALLVGVFRWSSWSPAVFYTQLLFTSFLCLSQNPSRSVLWRAFIVGRLPLLLKSFESVVTADGNVDLDWRASIQAAVLSLFRRTDILDTCDIILARNRTSTTEDTASLAREFLRHLLGLDLIDMGFTAQVDASISNHGPTRLQSECHDANIDLLSYLDLKLTSDLSLDDYRIWIDRIVKDTNAHNAFATLLLKRFVSLTNTLEVESLSTVCKVLCLNDMVLDIVALHIKVSDMVYYALIFLERYDCETIGKYIFDTAYSHLGDIVLFVQYVLARFQFNARTFIMDGRSVSSAFLRSAEIIYSAENLSVEETACFNAWFKALFDSSSEGIEDTILRATQPKMLLRISATLFSQAIMAMLAQKIDGDVLSNGVSYFTGPLLNWTLVGVIKALVKEIQQKGTIAVTHLEVLQTLILSPSCPRPVLALCSPQVAFLLTWVGKAIPSTPSFDAAAIRRVIAENANIKDLSTCNYLVMFFIMLNDSTSDASSYDSFSMHVWQEYPKHAIQDAFLMSKSQKAPKLDIEKCLTMTSPSKFLHLLWTEMMTSASLGELEVCKRIATFVLTTPRTSGIPPLLPIFIHVVLPSLIVAIDRQQTSEQTVNIELMATVISSVLTSMLHLEWAIRSVSGHHRPVLGESSSSVARRLAHYLQRRTHSTVNGMIIQRLASSQSFVANFPMFLGN